MQFSDKDGKKMTLLNQRYSRRLHLLPSSQAPNLGQVAADELKRSDRWSASAVSYWLDADRRGMTLRVTEFSPRAAPDYTCIVVQPTCSSVAMSCLPKASAALKQSGLQLS